MYYVTKEYTHVESPIVGVTNYGLTLVYYQDETNSFGYGFLKDGKPVKINGEYAPFIEAYHFSNNFASVKLKGNKLYSILKKDLTFVEIDGTIELSSRVPTFNETINLVNIGKDKWGDTETTYGFLYKDFTKPFEQLHPFRYMQNFDNYIQVSEYTDYGIFNIKTKKYLKYKNKIFPFSALTIQGKALTIQGKGTQQYFKAQTFDGKFYFIFKETFLLQNDYLNLNHYSDYCLSPCVSFITNRFL